MSNFTEKFPFKKHHNITAKQLALFATSSAICILANPVQAANLIANGDFSAGNTSFSSNYAYNPIDATLEGTYAVDNDPSNVHPFWSLFGDRTSGMGNMMVINGSETEGRTVWSQTVSVEANNTYTFSSWIASLFPVSPANLLFSINSTLIGTFAASETPGVWENFNTNWNSGISTSATIAIVDRNTEIIGNDFALDDIVLNKASTSVSEPASTMGFVAIGLIFGTHQLRKHRKTTSRQK
ncbi:hypothetical protein [Lusitaniella coriacea]|uniref:hypothetical protein n=1 Tax=Lusitaniella coriacea TaxID=1983105 RepID=UPI003CEE7D8E